MSMSENALANNMFANYPKLNMNVISSGLSNLKLLRLWYMLRFMDKKYNNGKGCVSVKTALKIMGHYYGYSKAYKYRLLKKGDNIFWHLEKHKDGKKYVRYNGIKRMAYVFNISRYDCQNWLPFDIIAEKDIKQVRANFYASIFTSRYNNHALARESINKYYNISKNTQRRYEKINTVKLEKKPTYILLFRTYKYYKACNFLKYVKDNSNLNENALKIQKNEEGFYLVLYQKGNSYYCDDSYAGDKFFTPSLRACNKEIKEVEKLYMSEHIGAKNSRSLNTFIEDGQLVSVPSNGSKDKCRYLNDFDYSHINFQGHDNSKEKFYLAETDSKLVKNNDTTVSCLLYKTQTFDNKNIFCQSMKMLEKEDKIYKRFIELKNKNEKGSD